MSSDVRASEIGNADVSTSTRHGKEWNANASSTTSGGEERNGDTRPSARCSEGRLGLGRGDAMVVDVRGGEEMAMNVSVLPNAVGGAIFIASNGTPM